MALSDHLRELRARLIRCAAVVVVAFGVALFFYDELFELTLIPYNKAMEALGESVSSQVVVNNITGPLLLQLKLCGVVAVLAASPYWLYQIWAFIVPGLHDNERKWSRVFAADRRTALHHRGGDLLVHPAQGHRGADRVRPR